MSEPTARLRSFRTVLLVVLLAATAPAGAQIPDDFTNLQVLPADIEKRELIQVMRGFATSLGVRCQFCHVGEKVDTLEDFDFADDDKEHTAIAREMMKMVSKINGELLPAAVGEAEIRVSCMTCHHGLAEPQRLRDVVLAEIEGEA